MTDHLRLGRVGGQTINLGEKCTGQAPLDRQSITALRLAPVEPATVQFRQAQRAIQDGFEQRFAIRFRSQHPGEFVLRVQQPLGVLAFRDIAADGVYL